MKTVVVPGNTARCRRRLHSVRRCGRPPLRQCGVFTLLGSVRSAAGRWGPGTDSECPIFVLTARWDQSGKARGEDNGTHADCPCVLSDSDIGREYLCYPFESSRRAYGNE